ncbi:MAG: alpha/beta family hydrolase [Pyrinomonadaceae bacterium]
MKIPIGENYLKGELNVPDEAAGIVLFAHGSGSNRHSPRDQFVARIIRRSGIGTLLFDLLTRREESIDTITQRLQFDIGFLAERMSRVRVWLKHRSDTRNLGVGFFGSSTGGGVALVAAAELGSDLEAVVSRGGRPDLADGVLPKVIAPTLLIVGERDNSLVEMNSWAFERLSCKKEMQVVSNATHLFEEPGTLEEVASLATDWFKEHLTNGKKPEENSVTEDEKNFKNELLIIKQAENPSDDLIFNSRFENP